jgi:uncharacterized protein YhbP (UPF0306 family)
MSTSRAAESKTEPKDAPDSAEVATRALEYIKRHHCMSVATDGPEGLWAATVFYVSERFALYFLSLSDTRHARNIESNHQVAATISDDAETWPEVGGIQLEGPIVRIDGPDERRRVLALFARRYPFVDCLWWTDPPPDPSAERRIYRIEPTRVLFVDHAFRSARSTIAATHLRR